MTPSFTFNKCSVAQLAEERDWLFLKVFRFVTKHVVSVSNVLVGTESTPVALQLPCLVPQPDSPLPLFVVEAVVLAVKV